MSFLFILSFRLIYQKLKKLIRDIKGSRSYEWLQNRTKTYLSLQSLIISLDLTTIECIDLGKLYSDKSIFVRFFG